MAGVFTPQKSANTTDQGSFPCDLESPFICVPLIPGHFFEIIRKLERGCDSWVPGAPDTEVLAHQGP